ncbi:MAG: hypothetical protein KBA38_01655 [Negativicutes bacterium]|jgi:hypothetical protein|nr:hypothetical protein [Negativicutes bacterium]
MISLESLQKWLGFPWADLESWLLGQGLSYEKLVWTPDERSQFEVDLNRSYVMQISLNDDKIKVEIAGKMSGRKEM